MSKKITVSVLMAVYNTDFVLTKRAIDSALNQHFQNFELIIIDDGSEYDTQQQLIHYSKKHEGKITYLRHDNCGQAASINRGVLHSAGEFIAILDSDDEYKPGHLSLCLQEMQYADLIASTTETIVSKEEDYYVPDKHDQSQLIHVDDCILFGTLFGKREIFMEIKFQGKYGADAHFYECAAQKYSVRKVDLRTYKYYRNTPGSVCATLKSQHLTAIA